MALGPDQGEEPAAAGSAGDQKRVGRLRPSAREGPVDDRRALLPPGRHPGGVVAVGFDRLPTGLAVTRQVHGNHPAETGRQRLLQRQPVAARRAGVAAVKQDQCDFRPAGLLRG